MHDSKQYKMCEKCHNKKVKYLVKNDNISLHCCSKCTIPAASQGAKVFDLSENPVEDHNITN